MAEIARAMDTIKPAGTELQKAKADLRKAQVKQRQAGEVLKKARQAESNANRKQGGKKPFHKGPNGRKPQGNPGVDKTVQMAKKALNISTEQPQAQSAPPQQAWHDAFRPKDAQEHPQVPNTRHVKDQMQQADDAQPDLQERWKNLTNKTFEKTSSAPAAAFGQGGVSVTDLMQRMATQNSPAAKLTPGPVEKDKDGTISFGQVMARR